jgi:hypothetical protein
MDDFFAPPPFKPDEALTQLKRTLRELKLAERGPGFEWQGKVVAEVEAGSDALAARLARKPVQRPDWDVSTLRSAADVRRFTDELRRRLARWSDGDD